MEDAFERMYRWYLLGCRIEETIPMTREQFAEQRLLQDLSSGLFESEIFNRTSAEWSLAREDAFWTQILVRLSNLNIVSEVSDLVRVVKRGRDFDEDGETGGTGCPCRIPPFFPFNSGSAALPIPAFEEAAC